MLAKLKSLHGEILAGIATLESIVSADSPDPAALARARWQLTRASRNRGLLIAGDIFAAIERSGRIDAGALAALRADHHAAIAASSRHIAAWTPERILSDWPGYQQASAKHRASMRERIAAEQSALYPILERIEHG
ncbi:MAG: hypothetical protein JSR79_00590 [Proteobacteria bacterium]|nr:hypothetical protein [Pseudomonadota bacterium]